MSRKILTIIGTRPQFVKAAVVSRALQRNTDLTEVLLDTGQHYDKNMADIFLDELAMPPIKYNLQIGSGLHGAQTAAMLSRIESVLLEEKPEFLLIYGDTNSTLAGALAAVKLHIPIAHVEAGLRSFNKKMPEEINRVIADNVSDILFAPTEVAVKNLLNQGISAEKIHQVGDVMYDCALQFAALSAAKSHVLDALDLQPHHFILTTIHRAENTDNEQRIKSILQALSIVSHEKTIVFPMHPRTKKVLAENNLLLNLPKNLKLIEPVGLLDMINLQKHAACIVTDSGGVQKEAFFYQTPCVTLRDETEWKELVTLGWNCLVSPDGLAKDIAASIFARIGVMGEKNTFPYGMGDASQKIADILSAL